jgi:hypothetical protein
VSVEAANVVSGSSDFIAKINIRDVTNFDAANYDVTYDPAVLEVTDVTDGLIGWLNDPRRYVASHKTWQRETHK